MIKQLYFFLIGMSPKQRIKNMMMFIPLIFSWSLFNLMFLKMSMLWFLMFSLFTWFIYMLNDLKDMELDKNHPKKKFSPLASWKLNKTFSLIFSIFSMMFFLFLSYFMFWKMMFLLFSLYLLNTMLYIFWVKNMVIVDIFSMSFWFILSWLLWIFLMNTDLSIWFLLILFFWALLLWFLKSLQEVKLWVESSKNIKMYNEEFLKQMISMLTTLMIMSYSFYTFNSIQNELFAMTIPFVLFWMMRYIYNIFYLEKYKESIEEVIFKDNFLLFNLLFYFMMVWVIMYLFNGNWKM